MLVSTLRSIHRSLVPTLKYRFGPKQKPGGAPPAAAPAAPEKKQPEIIKQEQSIKILSKEEISHMQAIGQRLQPNQRERLERLSKIIHNLELPTFLHFVVRNYERGLKLNAKVQYEQDQVKQAWESLQVRQQEPEIKKVQDGKKPQGKVQQKAEGGKKK